MNLHEGELIRRQVFKASEGLSAGTLRKLLEVASWLGPEYTHLVNRIVLYMTVLNDGSSSLASGDSVYMYLQTYGMRVERKATVIGTSNEGTFFQDIEFPLAYIGIPGGLGNLAVYFRMASWAITETHTALIEVRAYLLDEGEELVERAFV